ncbi:MAG: hypothetical protein HOP07_17535 [Bacteriovoracaceae bacterium]|nr:hypothetical protein [Bacteriovoracaceae bacterium]
MKFLYLFLIAAVNFSNVYASECEKLKDQVIGNNSVYLYLSCIPSSLKCIKLNDLERKAVSVDESTKVPLNVVSASLTKNVISVNLDKNSSCWFEKITEGSIGKNLAIVVKDTVLTNPVVQSKISGGQFQIMTGETSTEAQNLELCSNIFQKCQIVPEVLVDNKKTSHFNLITPNLKDYARLNNRYKNQMESFYWLSNKDKIKVYSDESFTKGTEYTLPTFTSGIDIGKKFFFAEQSFDYKNKEFIYKNQYIKTNNYGWIKREDLFPQNVLQDVKETILKFLDSYEIQKKCPKEFMAILTNSTKSDKSEILTETLMIQDALYRSHTVSLCALLGESNCYLEIKNIANKYHQKTCSELFAQ